MTATPESIALARTAAFAAADRLGTDIVALDVSEQLVLTDAFVIVSAPSERQVRAIVDRVEEELHTRHGIKRIRREGQASGRWVLLDFADLIVHVFAEEDREFYALERLWKDCPVIDVSAAVAEAGAPDAEA
ncbi:MULTISPECIES: ribosome silencing factor [Brevibacterium]|uniref:Ribosomal silencing factor RsfS n=1 Tax=Brevibacterium salitolerans TaxID=1403566 RepID=A0ABN2WCY6_9MICO|nr:ribosome silencing factor [Brevibacterium sp.]